MTKDAIPSSSKMIISIARLLAALPNEEIMDNIQEQELCTCCLDADLTLLFDDPENGYFFRWTSTDALSESENYVGASVSTNGRPDVMMSVLRGVHFSRNIGFAEVKSIQQRCNNFMISKDLVRLDLFSKKAINDNNLKGCLTIQSVGLTTTFYVTTLVADGPHATIEIGNITVPSAINNLAKYPMDLDVIINVLNIYKKHCKGTREEEIDVFTRCKRTSSDASLNNQLSSTLDRNRQCVTSHNYH